MANGYAVCFYDDDGNEHVIEGDSLTELQVGLAEAGYSGSSIRVTDEPGFTRGWVSATHWRAA